MTSAEKHYSQRLIPEGPRFLHEAYINHTDIFIKGTFERIPFTDTFCREFVEDNMIDIIGYAALAIEAKDGKNGS